MHSKDQNNQDSDGVSDVARKIWLAGLGAYGKAFNDVSEQYDKVGKDASHFFEELVSKGKKIDQQGLIQPKSAPASEKPNITLEERINRVRDNFVAHLSGDQIKQLNQKIDNLSDKLDKLHGLIDASKTTKKRPGKNK